MNIKNYGLCEKYEELSKFGDRLAAGRKDVQLLMTIPGINVYSAAVIASEIDDISRFKSKEKLASYADLVPRMDQSGNRDIRGHITKHGPLMLRFILVNAAHLVIRYSNRMRKKYLSIVRRLERTVQLLQLPVSFWKPSMQCFPGELNSLTILTHSLRGR